jgi:hypothetical protein
MQPAKETNMDRDNDSSFDLAELGTASGDTKGATDGVIPEGRQFWPLGGISDE